METSLPIFNAGKRPDGSTIAAVSFEAAFELAETELTDAAKAAATLISALSAGRKAAAIGDVGALSKAVQTARTSLRDLESPLDAAGSVLSTDFAAAMRDGSFTEEVVQHAAKAGLRGVRSVQGALFSFPVVVTPEPDKIAVRLGKVLQKSLRPSALIATLEKLRKRRTTPAKLSKLIDSFEHAFFAASREGHTVRISRVYDELTPMPDQKKDYTLLDFVADLYMLERSGILESSNKRILSFSASTGTRGGDAIRITTEEGEERLYSSMKFS
jgi:hypothetical protein